MSPDTQSASSFSMEDFEKALSSQAFDFQVGQTVTGTVASHSNDGALVDIGGKSAAFLPTNEASLKKVMDLSATLPVGDRREFVVIRDQNEDGQVTISLRRRLLDEAWERLVEQEKNGASFNVRVNGSNRGGVTADVEGLKGFIPRSHLLEKENIEGLMGQTLAVKFLEVNKETKKLVLSERLAGQAARMADIEEGQLISGTVASLKPFGVFVSFGGTTGLLHIKQISGVYVKSLDGLFKAGQPLKAMVVNIDEGRGRIALSTKVLESYPGEMVEKLEEVMASAEERAERARKKMEAEEQV